MDAESKMRSLPDFFLADVIGAVAATGATVGLMMFPMAGFRGMFRDFGSDVALPRLTQVALVPGFPVLLAVPALICLVLAVRDRFRPQKRRVWTTAAFGLACLGSAICLAAMYLPIYELAGKIKSE